MTREDQITLGAVGLIGIGIGWLIPGCPKEQEPAVAQEPAPMIEGDGNKIRTIEERIEAPDGTVTIRIITYVDGAEAEG